MFTTETSVFDHTIVVAKLLYASSTWEGFANATNPPYRSLSFATAGCKSRIITVLVQHVHDIVSVT